MLVSQIKLRIHWTCERGYVLSSVFKWRILSKFISEIFPKFLHEGKFCRIWWELEAPCRCPSGVWVLILTKQMLKTSIKWVTSPSLYHLLCSFTKCRFPCFGVPFNVRFDKFLKPRSTVHVSFVLKYWQKSKAFKNFVFYLNCKLAKCCSPCATHFRAIIRSSSRLFNLSCALNFRNSNHKLNRYSSWKARVNLLLVLYPF